MEALVVMSESCNAAVAGKAISTLRCRRCLLTVVAVIAVALTGVALVGACQRSVPNSLPSQPASAALDGSSGQVSRLDPREADSDLSQPLEDLERRIARLETLMLKPREPQSGLRAGTAIANDGLVARLDAFESTLRGQSAKIENLSRSLREIDALTRRPSGDSASAIQDTQRRIEALERSLERVRQDLSSTSQTVRSNTQPFLQNDADVRFLKRDLEDLGRRVERLERGR
jgi:chromosome segregation ATPase